MMEFIRGEATLGQLLKAVRLVDEGSDAKYVIAQGQVIRERRSLHHAREEDP